MAGGYKFFKNIYLLTYEKIKQDKKLFACSQEDL